MIEQLLSPDFIQSLGWALVHSLWQGALFALLLGFFLVLLRSYSAQARYVVAAGLLAAFFLTVGATVYHGFKAPVTALTTSSGVSNAVANTTVLPSQTSESQATKSAATASDHRLVTAESPTFRQRMITYFDIHLPLIVTLWLMGVLVLQLRLLGQLTFVQRLKSYGTERLPSQWAVTIQELEERLNIRRPVQYLTSLRVQSPLTVGWLRPAVLFPRALLAELKESQVIAILAHELAHVKRNDFIVNLLQRLLCTLFFFHPGVWWMSTRIEEEREHCCDDLAIQATGKAVGYAKTLVQLQEHELQGTPMALAYAGTLGQRGFKYRITRLLGGYFNAATYGEGIVTALILVLALGTAMYASGLRLNRPLPEGTFTTATDNTDEEEDTFVAGNQPNETPNTEDRHFDSFGPPPSPPPPPSPLELIEVIAETVATHQGHHYHSDHSDFDLLLEAVDDGDLKLVTRLLEQGVNPNQSTSEGWTALLVAASEDRPAEAQLLIDYGANPNFINHKGWTALIEAADEGSYATAEVLLKNGAQVDQLGGEADVTALFMAASEGHADILRLLIENGANIKEGGRSQPLHIAAEEGEVSVVRLLLSLGAEVNVQDAWGRTPLSYAAEEDEGAVVRLLLNAGADRSIRDRANRTALHYAAEEGADDVFEEMGGDMNSFEDTEDQVSLLLNAVEENELEIVAQLLAAGFDINALDRNGNSAIVLAAREGSLRTMKYLLAEGANVNARGGEDFFSPLFIAAREADPQMVKLLLDEGASLEASYNYRQVENYADEGGPNRVSIYERATPLIVAIEENDATTVAVLLDHGANANIRAAKRSYNVGSQFDWRQMSSMTEDQLRNTQNLNYSSQRWTPLLEAAAESSLQLVDLLLDAGADPRARTESGETPLSIALRTGNRKVVTRLERALRD